MKKGLKERRKSALRRLEIQLEKGMKNTKDGEVELTKEDKSRISNEIKTLKEKVK